MAQKNNQKSKELTPLEALEKVKMAKVFIGKDGTYAYTSFQNTKQYSIIETALKEKEELVNELNAALNLNECQTVKEWVALMKKKLKEKEKTDKALEILKEWFEVFKDENGWHLRTLFDIGRLTAKEGKLLKEILK